VRHVTRILEAAAPHEPATRRVTLDYDARHRRRAVLSCDDGSEVLLDLPAAVHLQHGDALLLDDGTLVAVHAAPEAVLQLATRSEHERVRIAWHLGNRHVATELGPGWLRIRVDHVLAELAARLGATVTTIEAPFNPEAGAYAGHAHERPAPWAPRR
jgi:urease accessory protein